MFDLTMKLIASVFLVFILLGAGWVVYEAIVTPHPWGWKVRAEGPYGVPFFVMGTSPLVVIHAASDGCSALTAADQAQIDRLSHVHVSPNVQVVPVWRVGKPPNRPGFVPDLQIYLEPASCRFHTEYDTVGRDMSNNRGIIPWHCQAPWACADTASLALEERALNPTLNWLADLFGYTGLDRDLSALDRDLRRAKNGQE